MPTVTIDGRLAEVSAGTNLIDAAKKVGVYIPHFCYHPALSVVGQCRMCLVKIEGMPRLQAGCSTVVNRDGMIVYTDTDEVREAQRAVMEFLLINHPLDCPICDQAGECALQDYSFEHGQSGSRFRYEEKRTYPGAERVPLGPHVLLNSNRCIQCTRCVRFTSEISKTDELAFLNRGARAEIGTFPGKPLDNNLSANVVDICPVGALTSTRFRFAERVWNLTKQASLCTGCDVGCNITLEHRDGRIRRYKPRFNPEVNDYWMCDAGRESFGYLNQTPRLTGPRIRRAGELAPTSWKEALDLLFQHLQSQASSGTVAVLASAHLTTEEAYLLARLAAQVRTAHRAVWVEKQEPRTIPTEKGDRTGREAAPNRRGVEIAGIVPGPDGMTARDLIEGGAARTSVLLVAGGGLGSLEADADLVARLRETRFLVVIGWSQTALAEAADLVLPLAAHPEKDGTFVNVSRRLQRFHQAFPAPGETRSGVAIFSDVLGRFQDGWDAETTASVFERLAEEHRAFDKLTFAGIPPTGVLLSLGIPERPQQRDPETESGRTP
jgi:NADH-quinone oxidoreductase subunit G